MPRRTQQNPDDYRVEDDVPCYVISIAAGLVGLHQQTLRYYERAGLVTPDRTRGNIRMYSNADIQRIRQAQRLIDELGVNLAGVEVIMRMNDQIQTLQGELQEARDELNNLRGTRLPAPYTPPDRRPT
jgi:MerR family transcriptional regulator/heat shock protein HspR